MAFLDNSGDIILDAVLTETRSSSNCRKDNLTLVSLPLAMTKSSTMPV